MEVMEHQSDITYKDVVSLLADIILECKDKENEETVSEEKE